MTLRALIVGTGFGLRVVAGCYKEAGMTVEVVSARDPGAVRAACAEPFDLVSIHSPPFLQAAHVNMALDHNRNVVCDKPFGVTSSDARQMLERAREKKVIHLLNFELRHDPVRLRLKDIIDSGAIGRVAHINWTYFSSLSRTPLAPHGWQFEADKGGGWIPIMATHMIDAIRWLFGEITEVDGRARIDVKQRRDKVGQLHPVTAADAFTALLETNTGVSIVIDSGWATPGMLSDHCIIIGTEGIIDVIETRQLKPPGRHAQIKTIAGGKEQVDTIGPFEGEATIPAMRAWAVQVRDAITSGRQIEPSFADGLATLEVVDRLHAAIRNRRS